MHRDTGKRAANLRVGGGTTNNAYLMQFQSDILGAMVQKPDAEELSGIGAAYMAGLSSDVFEESVFQRLERQAYSPKMTPDVRNAKYEGWSRAVQMILGKI